MNLKYEGLLFSKRSGESELRKLKLLLTFDLAREVKKLVNNDYNMDSYREVSTHNLEILLEYHEASLDTSKIMEDINLLERQLQQINNEIDNYKGSSK